MMSDISGGPPGAESMEPGEAGPAEGAIGAVETGVAEVGSEVGAAARDADGVIAGDAAAALHGAEAAARTLSETAAKAAEALPQEQRTQSR
jgi:hypothetical protein